MPFHLGKKPAREGAVRFAFARYFSAAALPAPPSMFGHFQEVGTPFGMLANDQYGDCVFAGAAHETEIWSAEAGNATAFTDQDVLSDYAAVAGFNAADLSTDQGTDAAEAASYRRKTGILDASGKRHTIDSYVALTPGDCDQLALAAYLMGAAGIGLRLPDSAQDQFDRGVPWDVIPNASIDGGHYVPCVGRNSAGNFLVITWGRLHAMTPAFYREYCDEAYAYVSLELLNSKNLSPEGFSADQLRADLAALPTARSTKMADAAVQGQKLDPGEVAAVQVALTNLVNEKAGWYRHMISDALVADVSTTAVAAAESYRAGKRI